MVELLPNFFIHNISAGPDPTYNHIYYFSFLCTHVSTVEEATTDTSSSPTIALRVKSHVFFLSSTSKLLEKLASDNGFNSLLTMMLHLFFVLNLLFHEKNT